MDPRSFFESIVYIEADDESPDVEDPGEPDIAPEVDNAPPPDVTDDDPPDIDDAGMDAPMGDDEDYAPDGNDDSGDDNEKAPVLSEKISLIMNQRLYQSYLSLLNTVQSQITYLKGYNEVIFTISPEALSNIEPLTKLQENIRMYLADIFMDTNYSQNLLYYNKCLNYLNLIKERLGTTLKKDIKKNEAD